MPIILLPIAGQKFGDSDVWSKKKTIARYKETVTHFSECAEEYGWGTATS